MNNKVYIVLLIASLFYSCKNNYTPKAVLLDYSLGSGWGYEYSIKVYTDGTAYLKKNSFKRSDSLWVKKDLNVDMLSAIILRTKEINLASKYEQQNIKDASFFYVTFYYNDGKASNHFVYGYSYPELLGKIRKYCDSLEQGKGWNQLKDTTITFSSLANFEFIPKIKGSNIRFPPPLPRPAKRPALPR
jgi:hypothetical protein